MILGEPNLRSIIELIEAEGCPECGEPTIARSINGPVELILDCGDVVDATSWIDASELQEDS